MKTFTAAVSVALYASSALASAPSVSGTQWTKTLFLDDFTGSNGQAPDSSKWILETGTQYAGGPSQWGTGEIETYTTSSSNIHQAGNGNLNIIPIKGSNGKWTSARMETVSSSFAAPAGGKLRFEASISMPAVTSSNGLGYWPAFWALGSDFRQNRTNWPAVGEIDIMENVNGADTVSDGLHCDVNPGGKCNEPNGLGQTSSCTNSRCPGNFHIYEVVIDRTTSPEQLKFWVDRSLRKTITANDLGSTVWANTIHKGFYLVLNVAMGGSYPNAVAGTTTPTSNTVSGMPMSVDYVAVWST
ncbi:glycoside hydrolase family 16 protein [Dothistroma septosporum NZE10]|uniref:Glycoside hydrolase family 16 protein n=1 Tax=Dothistroma septosporum (strain NZE10 / CBS 128990) TaxID=675120 RepID=M2YM18_DOTSN|nr:glycoside hydrolase family 16 protein [Dothistroma septosporum NZE10]